MEPSAGNMGVGDIILAAFKICSDRWRQFARLGAKLLVPIYVLGLLSTATIAPAPFLDLVGGNFEDPERTEALIRAIDPEEWVRLGLTFAGFAVVYFAAYSAALAASLAVAIDHEQGLQRADGEILASIRPQVLSMTWVLFLVGLLATLALLLLIVPGVWLWVSWTIVPVALVVERKKGWGALRRSFGLVRRRWWPTLLVVVLTLLSIQMIRLAASGLPSLLLPATVEENAFGLFFVSGIFSIIVSLFAIPLTASVDLVLYRDLVARADGVADSPRAAL